MEYNVRYWGKRKELLTNAKSDSRALRGLKARKSAYFTNPDFSSAKLEKKNVQVNTLRTGNFSSIFIINP
jgi:hypothetical protein